MKLCYLVVVVVVLWTSNGEAKSLRQDRVSDKQHKIVRKQQVPTHVRKQYIDIYGGNSVMGNPSFEGAGTQSFIEGTDNGESAQANVANTLQGAGISLTSGLTQNQIGGGQVESMSNDLVDSSESTDGRQMIGNGIMQDGAGLDMSVGGGSNLGAGLGGSLSGGIGAGLGGGSIDGGLGASFGGLGGGRVDIGGGAGSDQTGVLNDGLGAAGGGGLGMGGGGVETIGGGSLGDSGIGGGGLADGGIGGGSFGGDAISGGNVGDGGMDGGSLGGGASVGGGLGDGGLDGGSLGGSIGAAGLNSVGDLGGLGDNLGGGGSISDGLAGLGGNIGGSLTDGIGLDALGSRIAAGSKAQNFGGPLGGAHRIGFAGLGGNGPGGLVGGMQSDHQTPLDMQLSDAPDENPSMMHPGLASILPGKIVQAHVSDKPSSNRPAITGPSINAALQVQNEAKKQHQKRLQTLKLKLKKLRERLEKLQNTGSRQDTMTSKTKQASIDTEEIDTLNELRLATQDAIKELHSDYPHAQKHERVQPKHESLGSKLKSVDFTAKETGDTLEELLKLLDPELQDKKRGQVDSAKGNNTRLDEEAESKLASLTKKAEDEVDKLASQNPKPKTVLHANAINDQKTAKIPEKPPKAWKGLLKPLKKGKLKNALIQKDGKKSTKTKKILNYKRLGCWRDDPNRVVPSLENTSTLLKDGYKVRKDSVKKCATVAKGQGFHGFAVENGGQCFGGQNLLKRYKKYGRSRDCASDGRGGDYAMEVYIFH